MANIFNEYLADKSPVITVDETELEDNQKENLVQTEDEYSLRGHGIQEPKLKNLRKTLSRGSYLASNEDDNSSDGPYLSSYGLKAAHADGSGVYIIENEPVTEQASKEARDVQ